jgi:hypothetical protein
VFCCSAEQFPLWHCIVAFDVWKNSFGLGAAEKAAESATKGFKLRIAKQQPDYFWSTKNQKTVTILLLVRGVDAKSSRLPMNKPCALNGTPARECRY